MFGLLNPKNFELIILPTEKCNFRCLYCYEDFKLGKMNSSVIDGVVNLIKRRVGALERLHISWFGGEPLLAQKVMLEISEKASLLCKENNVVLSGSVTTNGYYLTPVLVAKLAQFNQKRYQISLDGIGTTHDKTRRRADGKGTFDEIWANLKALHTSSLDFSILLRLHVHKNNIDSIKMLIHELNSDILLDSRFSAVVKSVGDWGGDNLMIEQLLDHKEVDQVSAEVSSTIKAKRLQGSSPHVCYASRPNSLVIRADGKVQKCTVMLDDERNTVGVLGSDGSLRLNRTRMGAWMRGFENLDQRVLSCPAANMPAEAPQNIIPCIQVNDEITSWIR